MRRFSEVVCPQASAWQWVDVRRRMGPPHRQSVAQILTELGFHLVTRCKYGTTLELQAEVVPVSEKDPESWSATDRFAVVLQTDGLNPTELTASYRERGHFPEQVACWRQAHQAFNDMPVLTLKEQEEIERLRAQDQRESKRLWPKTSPEEYQKLRIKENALVKASVLL